MKHYRVVISLIHVKDDDNQPELESLSLPGVKTEHKAYCLFKVICSIGEILRRMGAY